MIQLITDINHMWAVDLYESFDLDDLEGPKRICSHRQKVIRLRHNVRLI